MPAAGLVRYAGPVTGPGEAEQKRSWYREALSKGNATHVVVARGESKPVDLPLTAVVIGAVLAPWLLAIGVVVAVAMGYGIRTYGPAAASPETDADGDTEPPEA
jgi:hypothetical protein